MPQRPNCWAQGGEPKPACCCSLARTHSFDWKWLPGVDETEKYEFAITLRRDAPQSPKMRKRDRDRADALRLAGGSPPSLRDRAVALARERGEVRIRDLTEAGIPRCYLSRMCEGADQARSDVFLDAT
jgi:hypothetical protein